VVQQYPSGAAIKEAGVEQLAAALKAQHVRRPEAFAEQLHPAATAQEVTITGSATAARLISELAVQLAAGLARRDQLEQEIEAGLSPCPPGARAMVPTGFASVLDRGSTGVSFWSVWLAMATISDLPTGGEADGCGPGAPEDTGVVSEADSRSLGEGEGEARPAAGAESAPGVASGRLIASNCCGGPLATHSPSQAANTTAPSRRIVATGRSWRLVARSRRSGSWRRHQPPLRGRR
jgi:hypothetical protein